MAAATATFTKTAYPNGKALYQDKIAFFGTIAVTASPATYPAGGIPLSFVGNEVYSQNAPLFVSIYGILGYAYSYDATAGTLRMYLGGTETAGDAAIPANVSGDTIRAEAIVSKAP